MRALCCFLWLKAVIFTLILFKVLHTACSAIWKWLVSPLLLRNSKCCVLWWQWSILCCRSVYLCCSHSDSVLWCHHHHHMIPLMKDHMTTCIQLTICPSVSVYVLSVMYCMIYLKILLTACDWIQTLHHSCHSIMIVYGFCTLLYVTLNCHVIVLREASPNSYHCMVMMDITREL